MQYFRKFWLVSSNCRRILRRISINVSKSTKFASLSSFGSYLPKMSPVNSHTHTLFFHWAGQRENEYRQTTQDVYLSQQNTYNPKQCGIFIFSSIFPLTISIPFSSSHQIFFFSCLSFLRVLLLLLLCCFLPWFITIHLCSIPHETLIYTTLIVVYLFVYHLSTRVCFSFLLLDLN